MSASPDSTFSDTNSIPQTLMRKVVFVGVAPGEPGGISAVLNCYRQHLSPFQMAETTCSGSKFTKILIFAATFFKLLFFRIKGCRIAHIHIASYNSFRRKKLLLDYALLLGYKVIYHLHGGEFNKFAPAYGIERIRRVFNKCSAVIVLSKSWQQLLAGSWQINNTVILNNIVPKPDMPVRKTGGSSMLQLTFLGIIGDRKGIFDLLQVLSADNGFYRNKIRLTVGGNGEISRLQKFIAEHGLQDMVKYSGWISGEDKKQLLQSTDIFLLPSHDENLPVSVLEAMSYGIPVITTPVGGIPEVIKDEHNGLLVTPGDPTELDQAMKKLIASAELRRKMSANNLIDIQEFFPEKIMRQLQQIYESVLSDDRDNSNREG